MKEKICKSKIKYVFVDIDDTILDFAECSSFSMLSAAKDAGISFPDNFIETFHRINNHFWHMVERKEITADELHRDRWNTIFAELHIPYDGHAFEDSFRKYLNVTAIPVKGADDFLRYLSSGYSIAAASNSSFNQQKNRLEKAGFFNYFDKLFISEKVGASKPSEEFFDKCLSEAGINNPSEAVMIGDSLTADINGASDYGIKTIWFNKRNQPVPADCKADVIIYNLSSIKDIL